MQLTWQKLVLVGLVLGAFVVLAALGKLPNEAITAGIGAAIGWLGGLFTPTPEDH